MRTGRRLERQSCSQTSLACLADQQCCLAGCMHALVTMCRHWHLRWTVRDVLPSASKQQSENTFASAKRDSH
jgi:hypothetical protein